MRDFRRMIRDPARDLTMGGPIYRSVASCAPLPDDIGMVRSVAAPPRENYQDEAESPFLPGADDRIREWGPATHLDLRRAGVCWHNAREAALSAPDDYLFAEGIAFNGGEWSGHGWVVRKCDCEVVECTTGYETSTKYRGVCFEIADVEAFIDQPSAAGGLSRREQWRKLDAGGSVLSEAPGVLTILAYEYVNQGVYWLDYWEERKRWLNSGKCPP